MTPIDDKYFQHLCDSLGFICIGVDRDLGIVYWNRQAATRFAQSVEEVRGKCLLDFLDSTERPGAEKVLRSSIATRTASDVEIKFFAETENPLTYVLVVSPILTESGECTGASLAMRDISQRKRLSQELARTRRMASLGKMAEGVAHNFNNIFGGMMACIDCALTSDSPRELRKTLRMMADSIGRATRITNQLAAFAKRENELQDESAELNVLVDRFLERVRELCRVAGAELVTRVERMESGPIEAHRLLPVLESLSQNALDAMEGHGTLTIDMQRDKNDAVIRIIDTGYGIPQEAMEHLFEPFFTTKGGFGSGTADNIGLGLAAVHGLVSEMGGTIKITSKVGHGTTVTLRLPLRRESDTNMTSSSNPVGKT